MLDKNHRRAGDRKDAFAQQVRRGMVELGWITPIGEQRGEMISLANPAVDRLQQEDPAV
jgi:hypothetical protein